MFEEIGKIVVIWASIEQTIILQTSAMAALKTDGKPTDYLRLDFKRLRKTWFDLCRTNFSPHIFNKTVNPLNVELVRLSEQRGTIVHSNWHSVGRGKLKIEWYEQKEALAHFEDEVGLRTIREIRHDSFLLSKRVHEFAYGKDSGKSARAFLKTVPPVVPGN